MKSEGEPSEEQTVVEVTHKEKHTRKIIVPPKSPKLSKVPKRTNSLIKKFKLHTTKSTKFDKLSNKSESVGISTVKRETPEGDDNFMFSKSITESSWKSAENLTNSAPTTPASIQNDTDKNLNIDNTGTNIGKIDLPERTKSLENLKNMPAYGDLIVDPDATTSIKNGERKDHLYKVLVIGDLGTGKTSIIKRYVHRFFTQHYRATIGVDFALKVLHWDENTLIRLQLWDIAGQERYGNMTRVYYKEAVGAFIVFDVSRASTFESVDKWKKDLDKKVQLPNGAPIPCVLLANKCDQDKEGMVNNPVKMDEYCKEKQFTAWFETSAKDNINIDEAGRALVSKILENDAIISAELKDEDKFSLTGRNAQRDKKFCSC